MMSLFFSGSVSAKSPQKADKQFRQLSVIDYLDKVKAGWIGQMAGVGRGAPTEFRYNGRIIPEDQMPLWKPEMINQFNQDDIYVEMTFIRTLELYGLDVSIRQAGVDFANSKYQLWHANKFGRDNLRSGIAPPDSGHPEFSKHSDDIDYQIEADYSGLIAPGMPNVVIELGEKFGRLMNYGDGVYGGQFVGAMYAEAFFETDIEKIILTGLKSIPAKSAYYECITDVIRWYHQNPDDWKKTWDLIEQKYQKNPDYRKWSCNKPTDAFNIDVKINGAYIVMGLLYGQGDLDETMIISTRCGQDSDCNPSNAAGILFTTIGFKNLPDKFKSALNSEGKFSHTPYNFPTLITVCEKLARQSVVRSGGKIEKDNAGREVFVILEQKPKPSRLEKSWKPGPIANSRFTDEEMKLITVNDLSKAVAKLASGWKVSNCGSDMSPGLVNKWNGKENVLLTHPKDKNTPCIISKGVSIPKKSKNILQLAVSHHPQGDWDLIVKANSELLLKKTIGKETVDATGWADIKIDLSKYAGREINLQLLNAANGWFYEAGYWGEIKVVSSSN